MPHAAVIAASVTVGAAAIVGATVAYEMYRESHGKAPLMESVRAGWDEFRNDMRRGLWDFRESMDWDDENGSRNAGRPSGASPPRSAQTEDDEEMRSVRQELDEMEMFETSRSSGSRFWSESGPEQSVRRRPLLQGAQASQVDDEDHEVATSRLIDLTSPEATTDEAVLSSLHQGRLSSSEQRPLGHLPVNSTGSVAGDRPSPASVTVVSDDDFVSRASSPSTQYVSDGNMSDNWTQLEDSLPGSPISQSWHIDAWNSDGNDQIRG